MGGKMAANKYSLYSDVIPFYSDLATSLENAKHEITMMYFIFDYGNYSSRYKRILIHKVSEGLRVRLMVDYLGTLVDRKRNMVKNFQLLKELKENGVEIIVYHPSGPRITFQDRMHIKLCAIDDSLVYVGGSNIGDNYPEWQDSNLKIEGEFGKSGHDIYDFVAAHSKNAEGYYSRRKHSFDISSWRLGDAEVLLTIPGYRQDIFYKLIDLMLRSKGTIYLRHWYFLPNRELMNILLSQLERNTKLRVLLSDKTKIPIIDWANPFAIEKLVKAGAEIYRFNKQFMHSKISWNDEGQIIFGSANLDDRAFKNNFELCLNINNKNLSTELTMRFNQDILSCIHHDRKRVTNYNFRKTNIAKLLYKFSPYL